MTKSDCIVIIGEESICKKLVKIGVINRVRSTIPLIDYEL
jgi:hypothetical protein